MEEAGAPEEVLQHYRSSEVENFVLYQDNIQALDLFLGCRPQRLVISSMSGVKLLYDGIDRSELVSLMDIYSIKPKKRPYVLRQVQLIETGAKEKANAEK
ncbi:DUF1799 domain-containing protein [Neptuniibacter sp.]|uniref:DUF1799 domain-containing protein n=1 Tax=Neptuniibacter sp. TaxID=1962643 RepID=UPI0026109823|nr:DUF1799 domain-containing protein [Neptuniibacter sp.]MCP4595762.1 DUF1799 domain-containing protein [Neptuniibacter sp.]